MKTRVLFVCLGNICRSPMAEGAFLHLLEKRGIQDQFDVDSAGTAAYHVGELADPRMRETAKGHGITLNRRARAFKREDHVDFDIILAMDEQNYQDILDLQDEQAKARVYKMGYFIDKHIQTDIPDPYYGGNEGFEKVYDMLMESNTNLLEHLLKNNV